MQSTYKILYSIPQPIEISVDNSIPVQIKSDTVNESGYTNAKVTIEVTTKPYGANPTITANDNFYAIDGFELTAEYDQTNNFTINFDTAGEYTINLKVVDGSLEDTIIVEKSETIQVTKSIKLDEATAAVIKVESSTLRVDYEEAVKKVNLLDENVDKQSLTERLNAVNIIIIAKEEYVAKVTIATQAVELAEVSKLQNDFDAAKLLVEGLNEDEKVPLLIRLIALQKIINAEEYQKKVTAAIAAVEKLETSLSNGDVASAQLAVEQLIDDEQKKLLIKRINVVIAYTEIRQEANDAIKIYELTMQSFDEGDIDAFKVAFANLDLKRQEAFTALDKLPEGDEKLSLINRYYVAQNEQYSAYKMMLIGFANNKELQPVKIENVGGDKPYKVTFKGILPGRATSAYLFYPEDYLRKQQNNILYPKDKPEDISSQIISDSDNILIANNYIAGGQFSIICEIDNEWHQFIYEMDEQGQNVISVNKQAVSNITDMDSTWTVSKESLISKIAEANITISEYEIGYEVGDVTQEIHDVFKNAIDAAIVIKDSQELITILEVENAVKILQTARTTFIGSINISNKEGLVQKINAANSLILSTTVGTNVGEIDQNSVNELQTTIDAANIIRNTPDAGQEVINTQIDLLIAAIAKFNDNIITIGDYAETKMVAYETAAKEFFDQIIAKKKIK